VTADFWVLVALFFALVAAMGAPPGRLQVLKALL